MPTLGVASLELDDHAKVNDLTKTGMQKMTEAYLQKAQVRAEIATVVDQRVQAHIAKRQRRRDTLRPEINLLAQSPVRSSSHSELIDLP